MDKQITLKRIELEKLISRCELFYLTSSVGLDKIKKNIEYFNDDNKYDYYLEGRIKQDSESFEEYIKAIKESLIEGHIYDQYEPPIDAEMIYKMFHKSYVIFLDSSKSKAKFKKEFDYLNEERLYNNEGIKKGHILTLFEKNEKEEYNELFISSHDVFYDFLFFRLDNDQAIVFLNPYYIDLKKHLELFDFNFKYSRKLEPVEEFDDKPFDPDTFVLQEESDNDLYIFEPMYLKDKDVRFFNELENAKPHKDSAFAKFINKYKQFLIDQEL